MVNDDDESGDETDFDPTFATAGPRRSTFTPPPTSPASTGSASNGAAAPSQPELHDDDELANALAADLSRIASGTINVILPEPAAQPEPVAAEPTIAEPAVAEPVVDLADAAPPVFAETPAAPPMPPTAAPPVIPAPPTSSAPPPWLSAPAPDPSQAVPLAEGPPQRPVRRSLPDEDLLDWVGDVGSQPGRTLDVIEELESQLRLREEEAKEFHDWESTMLSLGTPDALAAVEEARPEFTGVLPNVPAPEGMPPVPPAPETGTFVLPEEPLAEWPAPHFEEPEPAVEAPVEPEEPEPEEPAVDEAQVDETWVEPTPEPFGEPEPVIEALVEPEPAPSLPAFDDALQGDPETSTPVWDLGSTDEPETAQEAEQAPFDWAFPAPDAEPLIEPAAPETAFEPDVVDSDPIAPEPIEPIVVDSEPVAPEPTEPELEAPEPEVSTPEFIESVEPFALSDFERLLAPEPAEVSEAEPESAPEPEAPFTPAPPFAPPALVEPPPFGPPILPSQAAAVAREDAEAETVEPDGEGDAYRAPTWADLPAPSAPAATTPARPFSFDELLSGPPENDDVAESDLDEEPPAHFDPEPAAEDAAPESIFIEPMSVAAGEGVPTDTGSVRVIDQAYEEELDDDVDETDRAFEVLGPVSVDTAGIAVIPTNIAPPSGPISTVRVPEDEIVLIDNEPVRQRVFSLEDAGLEPTPIDHRIGRAARMFWLWFAANSSILSLGLGATIFMAGMSLRQAILGVLAGVALSFIPLGLTTLAGKRSGQPTMVVSRATFGLVGNVAPAALALVTRVFWGAALLWLLASSVAIVLVGADLNGMFSERQLLLLSLAVAFLLAVLVAFAGYPLIARIQLILSIVSGVLIVGLIAMTAQYIDVAAALSIADGPWILTVTGAVLVFSFVGLVWANSGADLARYQRVGTSGGSSMLWATFGTTLPSFLLIGYGALLAASNQGIASGFQISPLDTLAMLLPAWYPIPLLAATALSLLSGIILTLYSGGFALQSIGVRLPRQWSIVIVGALLGALALLISFGVTGINELFRDAATTLAVPTAAWAGIFAAETMIRNRRFETQSLLKRGGVYPDVNWVNLASLVGITAIGFGLTTATVTWLGWQGYLFGLLGLPLDSDLAGTDLGVLVALALGLLVPIVAGIPTIRNQEATKA